MAPTPLAEARALLEVARDSIAHGVRYGNALGVEIDRYPATLRERRATFVTLRVQGELRGCTGGLEPVDPLVRAVARSAFRSAFDDPRFPPVATAELAALEIHISILSALEPLSAGSQAELLDRLRPGIDGVVLRDGRAVGTFLPSVWKTLPAPPEFLAELKRKAGLPRDHWSPTIAFQRYTVEEIS
jgi:AmmeMemoRadiSam system protein A